MSEWRCDKCGLHVLTKPAEGKRESIACAIGECGAYKVVQPSPVSAGRADSTSPVGPAAGDQRDIRGDAPVTILPDTKGWMRMLAARDADIARLTADSRRWRTVERAVEEGYTLWFERYGDHVTISQQTDASSESYCGPTLADAVDALQEPMDKEAE